MRVRVEEKEYKGRPILQIFNEDSKEEYKNYPIITIGTYKAVAIVEALENIKKFVEKHRG